MNVRTRVWCVRQCRVCHVLRWRGPHWAETVIRCAQLFQWRVILAVQRRDLGRHCRPRVVPQKPLGLWCGSPGRRDVIVVLVRVCTRREHVLRGGGVRLCRNRVPIRGMPACMLRGHVLLFPCRTQLPCSAYNRAGAAPKSPRVTCSSLWVV